MEFDLILKIIVATAPVLVFLVVFNQLDSFDLISTRAIAVLIFVGAGTAWLALQFNSAVLMAFPSIGHDQLSQYVAPLLEEAFKAIPIIVLFHRNRLGYKLDAGIAGFAVGAGFALVENIFFLLALGEASLTTWLVRGLGTAVMHGGATAIFALIAHEMTERQAEDGSTKYVFNAFYFVPGYLAAVVIHGVFNHFTDQPLVVMVLTLLLVPLVMFLAFAFNEKATNKWLRDDSEAHRAFLVAVKSGKFWDSDEGKAVQGVVARSFTANINDVTDYIQLKTELVLKAEELILASQEEEEIEVGEAELDQFERLMVLEGRLGRLTLKSIEPHLGFSRNDEWELSRLRQHIDKILYG